MTPDVATEVVRGVVSRSLQDAPEMREPLPLTSEEVLAYSQVLSSLGYPTLVKELSLLQSTYEQLAPALPDWRLQLSMYPHPIVQKRLLVLNELYQRTQTTPKMAYTYQRNRAMLEWGAAGAVVGGLVGYFTKKELGLGAAVGGVLGAVAGRSDLLQTVLMEISTKAVMI